MNQYIEAITDELTALPIAGAEVFIYDDNNDLAILFASDNTTEIDNPLITNEDGEFSFYAPRTELTAVVYYGGRLRRRLRLLVGGGYSAVAQTAASAAQAAAGVGEYPNTAAGLAATAIGGTFWVDQGDGTGLVYRHDAGPVATALNPFLLDPTASGAAALLGAAGGTVVQDYLDIFRRIDTTSANLITGSAQSGALLTNNPSGDHDGGDNTAYGFGTFVFAEHVYASDAFGNGALYRFGKDAAGPSNAHSGSAFGYQAGHNVERGVGFFVAGVDAAFAAVEINGAVVLGRHVFNLKTGNDAELTGVFVMAEQAFRYLGVVDDLIGGGRFTMANSPADGTSRSIVWGNESLISAKAYKANVHGHLIMASTTPLGGGDYRIVSESGLSGDRNHYGAKRAIQTESHGVEGFFLLLEDAHESERNAGLGYQHGYNVRGTDCLFLGYRAGWRGDTGEASPVGIAGAVCIGPLAGFGQVEDGEFYLGNSDSLASHLMWGSFDDQRLHVRSNKFFYEGMPNAANDAAAAGAGIDVGQQYFDTTKGAYTKRVA